MPPPHRASVLSIGDQHRRLDLVAGANLEEHDRVEVQEKYAAYEMSYGSVSARIDWQWANRCAVCA